MKRDLFLQFSAVWNLYCTKPLPPFLRGAETVDDSLPSAARPLTPLVGALLGLCAAVFGFVMDAVFNRPVSAIAVGLFVPLWLEFLTDWAGMRAANVCFTMFRDGGTIADLMRLEPEDTSLDTGNFTSQIVLLTIYLLRASLFAALAACGANFWFVAAFSGAYLVRAELSSLKDTATGREFFPVPHDLRFFHWYFAFAVILIAALFSGAFLAGLVLLAAVWGLGRAAVAMSIRLAGGSVSSFRLDLFGFVVELVLLLLGVFLFA